MATMQHEGEESVVIEQQSPPPLESLFSSDQNGECVTEEGLDWIWPTDDREPVVLFGKGHVLPHTCEEFIPCYEKYGDEVCLKFVFNGSKIPPVNAQVPLSDSGLLMLTALAAIIFLKMKGKFA